MEKRYTSSVEKVGQLHVKIKNEIRTFPHTIHKNNLKII